MKLCNNSAYVCSHWWNDELVATSPGWWWLACRLTSLTTLLPARQPADTVNSRASSQRVRCNCNTTPCMILSLKARMWSYTRSTENCAGAWVWNASSCCCLWGTHCSKLTFLGIARLPLQWWSCTRPLGSLNSPGWWRKTMTLSCDLFSVAIWRQTRFQSAPHCNKNMCLAMNFKSR